MLDLVGEAVKIMANTCMEAESIINYEEFYRVIRVNVLSKYSTMSQAESITSSAVKTSRDVNAKLILVISESGRSAQLVAKYRPSVPILVLTPNEQNARQIKGMSLH
jgi:pyruvate kinase